MFIRVAGTVKKGIPVLHVKGHGFLELPSKTTVTLQNNVLHIVAKRKRKDIKTELPTNDLRISLSRLSSFYDRLGKKGALAFVVRPVDMVV